MSDEIKKYIEIPAGIGEMRSKLYVLSNQCAKYDGFSSIPSFDSSLHPYSDIPFAYVYMRDGVPIGVLVCIFKACERCEIQSVVLPRFRMQGVFNSLVMEAFKVLSGFGFRKFWFRIPKESISGERVLARYSGSRTCERTVLSIRSDLYVFENTIPEGFSVFWPDEDDAAEVQDLISRCMGPVSHSLAQRLISADLTNRCIRHDQTGRLAGFSSSSDGTVLVICTDPEFRRQGVGTALMGEVSESIFECPDIPLEAEVDQTDIMARRFFRSLDFKVCGVSRLCPVDYAG